MLASSACVVAATVSVALEVALVAVGQVSGQSGEVAVPGLVADVPVVLGEVSVDAVVPVEPVVPVGVPLVEAQSHGSLLDPDVVGLLPDVAEPVGTWVVVPVVVVVLAPPVVVGAGVPVAGAFVVVGLPVVAEPVGAGVLVVGPLVADVLGLEVLVGEPVVDGLGLGGLGAGASGAESPGLGRTAAVTGTSPSSTVRGDEPGVPDSTCGAAV